MDDEHSDQGIPATAITAIMTAQINALAALKDREFQWLERFTVLVGPAVGFLILRDPSPLLSLNMVFGLLVGYWLVTLWFQFILKKERRRYYRLLRSIVRAQNLLGLYQIRFLAIPFANSAFPKGLGPGKSRDGTQPFSSFFHRQLYTLIFFSAIASSAVYQRSELLSTSLGLVVADVLWLVLVFSMDRRQLYKDTVDEVGLAGWDPAWSPREEKT